MASAQTRLAARGRAAGAPDAGPWHALTGVVALVLESGGRSLRLIGFGTPAEIEEAVAFLNERIPHPVSHRHDDYWSDHRR